MKCSGEIRGRCTMERRVGQLLADWIGIIVAAIVIGYFSFNCVHFSPQVIHIDLLRPLPL
jgi:hypothetical protein